VSPPKELDWTSGAARPAPALQRHPRTSPIPAGSHPSTRVPSYLDYANGTLGDLGDPLDGPDSLDHGSQVAPQGLLHWRPPHQAPGPHGGGADQRRPRSPGRHFEFDEFTVTWEHRQFAGNNAEKGETWGAISMASRARSTSAGRRAGRFYPANIESADAPRRSHLNQPTPRTSMGSLARPARVDPKPAARGSATSKRFTLHH